MQRQQINSSLSISLSFVFRTTQHLSSEMYFGSASSAVSDDDDDDDGRDADVRYLSVVVGLD